MNYTIMTKSETTSRLITRAAPRRCRLSSRLEEARVSNSDAFRDFVAPVKSSPRHSQLNDWMILTMPLAMASPQLSIKTCPRALMFMVDKKQNS
mmetsp:Transcript_9273/g.23185  ORF Transcript_9273/g.23185 Transcript_9273/m.23185 type:complete len:94 (-) Transcript_9273:330-611(-)